MVPWTFWRLRRAWRKAQSIHAMEHEVGEPLSLTCKAVGHSWALHGDIDSYTDMFDADERRHFLVEYRPA
jgi:hypothetical protein